ncbi:MAG: hypothetical protein ACRDS0_33565 [Pseudonocardiaceae bacterium]
MTAGNGHRAAGAGAVTGTRSVVPVRYRPGVAGETACIVHVVPAHPGAQTDMAGVALCGALRPELVETVTPGQGMPCSLCLLSQANASLPRCPSSAPRSWMPPLVTGGRRRLRWHTGSGGGR